MNLKEIIKPNKTKYFIFSALLIVYFLSTTSLLKFLRIIYYPIFYYSNRYSFVCELDVCMQTPLTIFIELVLAVIYCYLLACIIFGLYNKIKKK